MIKYRTCNHKICGLNIHGRCEEVQAWDCCEYLKVLKELEQLQKGNIPNVMGSFEPTDEQIRKASYEWCESEYGNIEPHSTEGSLRRKYFKSAIKWYIVHKKIIGENVR
jgi:hypothetical protein